jgi:hypothetical protein
MARVPGNVVETNRVYVLCVFLSTTPPLFHAIMYSLVDFEQFNVAAFPGPGLLNLWYSC